VTQAQRRTWIVCGGREFSDIDWLYLELDTLAQRFGAPELVVHGAASGADTLAGSWASARGVECHSVPAEWSKFGRSAGSKRNQKMLDEFPPKLVIAFPGGRGTEDMKERARVQGFKVIEVELANVR